MAKKTLLKSMVNKAGVKAMSSVAALALMVVASNVSTCCWYFFGQEELPEGAKKLRRF